MVRQNKDLTKMVPHTLYPYRGKVGRSTRQEGLWNLGGTSRTSQGWGRSRLDWGKPLEGSPREGSLHQGFPTSFPRSPCPSRLTLVIMPPWEDLE